MKKRSVSSRFFCIIALLTVVLLMSGCMSKGSADTDILQEPTKDASVQETPQAKVSAPATETAPAPQPVAPTQETDSATVTSKTDVTMKTESAPAQEKNTTTAAAKSETTARKKLEQEHTATTSGSTNTSDVAGFGQLSILSVPSNAKIVIDGQEKSTNGYWYGGTPQTIKSIPAGNHIVKLVKPGYVDSSNAVYIPPGRNRVVDVTLTAK